MLTTCNTARKTFEWDLQAPLDNPPEAGYPSAEAVCRSAVEAECSALAAAWQHGARLAVDAAFVLVADANAPGSQVSIGEYQVAAAVQRTHCNDNFKASAICRRITPARYPQSMSVTLRHWCRNGSSYLDRHDSISFRAPNTLPEKSSMPFCRLGC